MTEAALTLHHVTVIVVTYNSRHCINSLAGALAEFPHVIFSDNASEDGTVQTVRHMLPLATVLTHAKNLGFGAANNRALAQVHTPYALLVNPDCEVNKTAALALLAYMQQDPQAAIAAPQIMRSGAKPEISYRWPSTLWPSRGPAAHGPCCVGFVTGAAMLIRIAHVQQIGFFDEDYFLYYEDEDLCLRLFQRKMGIVVVPDIQLTHASRGSVRGKYPLQAEYGRGFHHAQSKILFAKKHVNAQAASQLRFRTLWLALLSLPLRLLLPVPKHVARHWGRVMGLFKLA
jgi:N-acetylglucosaminyl-diphospho-decaprenol L-rhamnosyltransferase